MTTDRPNTELAAVVDQALDLAEQRGVRAAAAFLTQYGADFALICRVLQEPTRRRVREAVEELEKTRPQERRAIEKGITCSASAPR